MDQTTITLGATTLTVRPLSLRQLRTIFPEFGKSPTMPRPDGIEAAVEIIVAAATRDQPDITAEAVAEGSIPELTSSMQTILKLSGLISKGEAPAAAT